jgi:predicted nucleic acid-binding protein
MSGGSVVKFLGTPGPSQAATPAAETETPAGTARHPSVIDTSVAVKWYIPEAFSAEAKRYLGKGLDRHAPGYLLAESASVVLKRVRTRDPALRLTRDEARIVLAALQTAPIQFHEFRPLIELSFALAEEIGSSLYDGLFLALALQLGGQLVTADEKLFKKIRASQYADHVRWVEDAP